MCRPRMIVSFCVLASISGFVQADVVAQKQQGEQKAASSEAFVMKASEAMLAQIGYGQLAGMQAHSEDVRSLGRRIAQDHAKALKELITIADSKHIPYARNIDKAHKDRELRLAGLSGSEFDREYLKSILSDHEKALASVEAFARDSQDQELKTFAKNSVPTLQHHLTQIRETISKGATQR